MIMQARVLTLWSVLIAATLISSPANAARRCGNGLADGRFIVQGPLVDEFGDFCSIAVIPRRANSFSSLIVIDSAQFVDEIIILSPPFAHRPHRVVILEPAIIERSPRLNSQLFASPSFPVRPFVPFTTGSLGPFTTGSLGPFTTFSNSRPASHSVIIATPSGRFAGQQ
jgi:hypothetical protein